MARLTILHLSDLHLSTAEFKNQEVVLQALWRDLKRLREAGQKVDMVFFTGDLVCKGEYLPETPQNVKNAFISPLLAETLLPVERLFICPGNHDLDLTSRSPLLKPIINSVNSQDSLTSFLSEFSTNAPLQTGFEKFNSLLQEIGHAKPEIHTHFYRGYLEQINGLTISICVLNSGSSWKRVGKS